jgi:hypothetical protein
MDKLVARLLATDHSGFESRDFSKLQKWATYKKEWPTHSSTPNKYTKKQNKKFVRKILKDPRRLT